MSRGPVLGRRQFLALTGLSAVSLALASCTTPQPQPSRPDFILPTDPEVDAAERAREFSGHESMHQLLAVAGTAAVPGAQPAATWGYNTDVGLAALGPTIRAAASDRLIIDVDNQLGEDTSVHWHGLRLRNDMDGAPPVTQEPIAPGSSFRYSFIAPDPGTYWYHSHSGLQADRALFGALVIEDPNDATGADEDLVIVLDDWLDGAATPEEVFAALGGESAGHGHHDHTPSTTAPTETAGAESLVNQGAGDSQVLGGPSQHIAYPTHLANGRTVDDPDQLVVPPHSRIRFRLINAAAETPYRVALAGHELTVIAADGFGTTPYAADAVLIAPAQRIDVLVSVTSGIWPLVARVEGRAGAALAVIRTSDSTGQTPRGASVAEIPEIDQRLAVEWDLTPAEHTLLPARDPDHDWHLELRQAGDRYAWAIAGDDAGKLHPRQGDRVRLTMQNTSDMWHPMHLHGHTFAIREHRGLRRDTAIVLPRSSLTIEFDADNPGQWMLHCHNAYHFEAGMTANLHYIR